ncbi:hypothetical protein EFA46_007975 [Halarchaeum sp. CBA1220]|uniref:hypothetical protein n=1 Tax=Halarchaeum sp. CBA1220 TaxID=1853682 RepID=UPI000F3AA109|nr:hypothetical protein [Halarchaeum sp. CBA1220]QLC34141.1 hypothetical protein EFA46_007975 [Halarchaeum sp. CBA1220]
MDRRTLLRGAGTVALAALAGCAGTESAESSLLVASEDFHFDDDGALVVTAVVSNVGDARHGATVVFAPEVNGELVERRIEVELGAHETRAVETTYGDVDEADVSSLELSVSLEDVR